MKKILAISLALMMALALVACSNTENPSESGSSAASQSQPPESSEPAQEIRVIPDFPADKDPVMDSATLNAQYTVAQEGTLEERKTLARDEKLGLGALLELAKNYGNVMDDELAGLIAGRIKARELSAASQKVFANSETPLFRQAVAENPGVTQEVLDILMTEIGRAHV